MAGEAAEVGGIALALTLDTAPAQASLSKFKAELSSLTRAGGTVTMRATSVSGRQTAGVVTPPLQATKRTAQALAADATKQVAGMPVAITVRLGRIDGALLRKQIAEAIGPVPITVSAAGMAPTTGAGAAAPAKALRGAAAAVAKTTNAPTPVQIASVGPSVGTSGKAVPVTLKEMTKQAAKDQAAAGGYMPKGGVLMPSNAEMAAMGLTAGTWSGAGGGPTGPTPGAHTTEERAAPRRPRTTRGLMANLRREAQRQVAAGGVPEIEELLAQSRISVAGAARAMPARTQRGVIAAESSLLFGGGRQAAQRQVELTLARQAYQKAAPEIKARNIEREGALAFYKEHKLTAEQYGTELGKIEKHYEGATKAEQGFLKAEKAAYPTGGQMLQNIAAISVGMGVYGAAMSAAGMATQAMTPVLQQQIDALGGFHSLETRVTTDLGTQTTAMKGNSTAALAAATSTAGLSDAASAFVAQQLQPSAIAKAGATAMGQQVDLLRSAFAAQGQGPEGLYGNYGGFLGTGLMPQIFGGGSGLLKQMADYTSNIAPQMQPGGGALAGFVPDKIFGISTGMTAQAATADQIKQLNLSADTWTDAMQRGAKRLGNVNDNFAVVEDASGKNADAMHKLATSTGHSEFDTLADSGMALVDAQTGQVVAANQVTGALEDLAQGLTTATAKQAVGQVQQQLIINNAQLMHQLEFSIPAAFAAQMAATPMVSPFANVLAPASAFGAVPGMGATQGLSPEAYAKVQATMAQTAAGQVSLRFQQAAAVQSTTNQIAHPIGGTTPTSLADAAKYSTAMADVSRYTSEIEDNETQIAKIQLAQSGAEFANQMRLANRSLSDALGLAGKLVGPNNLGALQRQDFMLGYKSTLLSQGLQQRQINYSVASAGFVGAGQTGEERAARVTEAKIAANYQQQQLDIEKQRTAISLQMFNISAARGVEDTQYAKKLLQSGYDAATQISALTKKVSTLTAEQGLALQKANAVLGTAEADFATRLSAIGPYLDNFTTSLQDAYDHIETMINPNGPGYTTGPRGFASGGVSMVLGPTAFMAGEANKESVIVLRNPHVGTLGGGSSTGASGGMYTVNFNFSGAMNVRSDNDIQSITRQVMTAFDQRAALLGLRRNVPWS